MMSVRLYCSRSVMKMIWRNVKDDKARILQPQSFAELDAQTCLLLIWPWEYWDIPQWDCRSSELGIESKVSSRLMFHTQQERRLYITISCRDSTDWAYILYVFQGCMEERCNAAAIQPFPHSQSRLVALFPISCIFCAGKRFRIWIAVDRSYWKRINRQTVEGERRQGKERRKGREKERRNGAKEEEGRE